MPTLIPRPTTAAFPPGRFTLDDHTNVRLGEGTELAADLLRSLLAPATGLPLRPSPEGTFTLALDPAQGHLGDEGYALSVHPDAVLLRAAHPTGLLRGVQTIRQLLPPQALSETAETDTAWILPCADIIDLPQHPWRGAMLDVARHFQPVSYLRRYVDLLALHKISVFHLHLTDDQGWRMPVAAYPKLTEIGGYRTETQQGPAGTGPYDGTPHGGSYTRSELADLVRYAAARGVTVLPEIEMPGHVRAALAAYPSLGNHPERTLDVWTRWGVCDTVLGVHNEALDFCYTVLDEVMDVFPSPYLHIGGEECPTAEWNHSADARRRLATEGLPDARSLHGWFLAQIGGFLVRNGRRPVAWAEPDAELPLDFTVMTWRDDAHTLAAARRGHPVVNAYHRATYLDYARSGAPHEPPAQPGVVVDLRTVHAQDPVPAEADAEAAGRVLGTQAQLWTEFVTTPAHIEYLTYPRLCALADRSWSGPTHWTDFQSRLSDHTARLDALGIPHHP
ncbi:beta-N-acetylhexosaminidase [Streptomyces canus]|uniref:beta-N-acetylhexosaminidase n=1 Tax=Streptomyces canus TaxID=58343 RepID=UPI00035EBBA5|nr:beta-N-acetylhexosaminidase [Streptomyces canus]